MGVQYNTGAVSKLLEDEKKKNKVTYNTSAVNNLLGNTNASNALTQETAYRQSVLDAAKAVADQQAQANARKLSNTSSPSTGALSTQTKLNTTTPVVYEGSTAVGKTLPTATKTTTKQQAAVSTIQATNPAQEPVAKNDNYYVAPTITLDQPATVVDTTTAPAQQTTQQSNVQPTVYESRYTYDAEKPTYQAAEKQTAQRSSYQAPTYTKSTYNATPVQAATASFTPSQEYYDAMAETQRMLEQLKSGRTSYTDKISQSLKAIEDTSPFSYDFNSDPMFQQMLQGAMSSGKYAMQDTMGQAAALTGGYGSSYGQMVGQQAYNRYIDEAYDRIPDYWNMALTEYQTDLNNKYNKLNQYMNLDNTEWGRNYDTFNSQYQMANDQYNKEYNNFWQEQNFNENSRQWAESENDARARYAEAIRQYDNDFNHNLYREAIEDERYDENSAYEKYLNELAQYNKDREYERSIYENDRNFNYGVYSDDLDRQYRTDVFEYGKEQDAITNALNKYKAEQDAAQGWSSLSLKKAAQDADEAYQSWQMKRQEELDKQNQTNIDNELDYKYAALDAKNSSDSSTKLKDITQPMMKKCLEAYNTGGWAALEAEVATIPDNYDTSQVFATIVGGEDYGQEGWGIGRLPYDQRTYTQTDTQPLTYHILGNDFTYVGQNPNLKDKVTPLYTDEYGGDAKTLDQLAEEYAASTGISVSEAKKKLKELGLTGSTKK